jgi:hypothetical protein
MEGSSEYIEKVVAENQQGVVLKFGGSVVSKNFSP